MMKWVTFIVFIFWSPLNWASHSFGGIDLCALYPERMPPGLPVSQLPLPDSQGAQLTQEYCTQCHNLPGPGRHTVAEWPDVMERMNMLMDISSRFGGLLGKLKTPSNEEKIIIETYLLANALKPFIGQPDKISGRSFGQHCSNCHALPDPAQHSEQEWPQVIKRMQHNMSVMKYEPISAEVLLQIQRYLQLNSNVIQQEHIVKSGRQEFRSYVIEENSYHGFSHLGSWFALGPFFLLALAGVIRWWSTQKKYKTLTERTITTGNR
ncbi:MAG: hypothetical protein OQK73_01380 [Gammaproteobacteria bacterium]|nr:hypothetical protein [Gammaproteobacteria bacterium]